MSTRNLLTVTRRPNPNPPKNESLFVAENFGAGLARGQVQPPHGHRRRHCREVLSNQPGLMMIIRLQLGPDEIYSCGWNKKNRPEKSRSSFNFRKKIIFGSKRRKTILFHKKRFSKTFFFQETGFLKIGTFWTDRGERKIKTLTSGQILNTCKKFNGCI